MKSIIYMNIGYSMEKYINVLILNKYAIEKYHTID